MSISIPKAAVKLMQALFRVVYFGVWTPRCALVQQLEARVLRIRRRQKFFRPTNPVAPSPAALEAAPPHLLPYPPSPAFGPSVAMYPRIWSEAASAIAASLL